MTVTGFVRPLTRTSRSTDSIRFYIGYDAIDKLSLTPAYRYWPACDTDLDDAAGDVGF